MANEFIQRDESIYLNVPYAEAYISEDLFGEKDTTSAVAVPYGEGFKLVGIFNMRFFKSDEDKRESAPICTFNYPNTIITYPSGSMASSLQLFEDRPAERYRILKYYMGDVVMEAETVESVNNCTKFLNMITRGKIPSTIGYAEFLKIWQNNFQINNFNAHVPAVVLQMIWAEMCRNPDDITKPFRMTWGQGNADPNKYISTNMNNVAAATSVFSAMSFERVGEKIATSINMSRAGTEQRRSPVEEVITM